MKRLIYIAFLSFFPVFGISQNKDLETKEKISLVLNLLNEYASKADFQKYFDLFAKESTFIGTDATEIWNKKEFMSFAKPFFDKGKGWNFKSLKRNITLNDSKTIAWFDELLETQMKICRGSGVLEKIDGEWKIRQYVLSMTVPNDVANDVIRAKKEIEEKYILELKK